MKTNIELRRKILDGGADCKEFVQHKEVITIEYLGGMLKFFKNRTF